MSEALTRVQVEDAVACLCQHAIEITSAEVEQFQRILDHDAALRQEIEWLTERVAYFEAAGGVNMSVRIHHLMGEIERLREDLEAMARSQNAYKEIAADMEQERNEAKAALAQAEQREARLSEALNNLVRRCGKISYPADPSALEWNAAIDQAQQALSEKPPAT